MDIARIASAFKGVKSGVGAIIIAVGVSFCGKLEKKLLPIACFIIAFGLSVAFDFLAINFSAIWYILAGGAIGILTARFKKTTAKETDENLNGGGKDE